MIPAICRKPRRSASICRYEDFELDLNNQNKFEEKVTENSTKDTPISRTPVPLHSLNEIHNIIEGIQKRKDLEELCILERKKAIKNRLLKELYRNCSTNIVKCKKKNRNSEKSAERGKRTVIKLPACKTKEIITKPKLKKQVSLVPRLKDSQAKGLNNGRLSLRTYRNKSNDIV